MLVLGATSCTATWGSFAICTRGRPPPAPPCCKLHQRFSGTIQLTLARSLLALPLVPSGRLARLSFYGAIGAEIQLQPQQAQAIEAWAAAQRIADLQAPSPRKPSFHVTLGYCYRPMTGDSLQEVNAALHSISTELTRDSAADALSFTPAQLCVFNDMTSFVPWDASHNPF